jgi:ABC-type lipoprotein release transport system permease subunit
MTLPLLLRLFLFGLVVGPLPVSLPVSVLLIVATSLFPLVERIRGTARQARFTSWRWYLSDTRMRFLLFGVSALVVDFVLMVLAILVTLVLQAVGLMRGVPITYNYRNLRVRWHTALLTALAFTLVVGLMTVMLAFVNGMYALTRGSTVPGNVIVLADGATDEVFSDIGYGDIGTLANRDYVKKVEVRQGDREQWQPLVSWELYQVVSQQIPNARPGGRQRRMVQVRGIEDPVISGMIHELQLHDGGRWFDEGAGVQVVPGVSGEPCVQGVLGEGLARQLGSDLDKPTLEVGDTFELGPRRWIVVGILKSGGKTFDSEVWAKRKVVGEMLRKDTRSTAVFRVADGLDPAQVARDMTAAFKSPAIVARTEADYFESLNATNQQFLFAALGVAIFMAVGGIFGVMNTMFAAIAQRTRDIGVLRILGFGRWQILVSFFLESLLLALLGGILGCAIGSLCNGWSATSQLSGGPGSIKNVVLKLVVDSRILGCGLAFSLLMGCLGGLLPAQSAIRLKILDSLR